MVGLAVLMGVGLGQGVAGAATIYVSKTGVDTNDGLSWDGAKGTVGGGLAVAAAGDQVWVAGGTYVERITLKAGVALYGGFVGNETDLAQRDWVTHVTILDGSQAGRVVTSPSGAAAETRIDGFTIRNGVGGSGGGIYCSSSSPMIVNNTISGNNGITGGGGICCINSSPSILDNQIVGNTASMGHGGGIYCSRSSAIIRHNVVSRNTATGAPGTGYGGGIYSDGSSSSVISNNTIIGNGAVSGGGIYCTSSSPRISDNILAGNGAYSGGGVYCISSSPAIANNTIVGNSGEPGGGIYCSASSPAISNNIVAFNSLGICSEGGLPTLQNNCVYNPRGGDYAGLDPGTGDISVDPQLQAVDYGRLHVVVGSPCIDTGLDDVVQPGSADVDGETRIQGAHVDIGADEFNGATPTFTVSIVRVSTSGSDSNDGSNWTLAKRTVQGGIDAVFQAGGGQVWVAAGTYSERIVLKPWVHAYGGFAGTEVGLDERDWANQMTILDGGAAGSVVAAPQGSGICRLDGFTVRNGTGTGTGTIRYGGGVYCASSLLTVSNNTITGNVANWHGGGIYCIGSAAVISNNTITGNTSNFSGLPGGGGIFCGGSAIISDNTISGNTAAFGGGGVCCSSGSPKIMNNRITENIATSSGGGICSTDSASPVISNNRIMGNWSEEGGGIHLVSAGRVAISNNTIVGNVAKYGGGMDCGSSTGVISNNIIAFNSSGLQGWSGRPELRYNCLYNPMGADYSGLSPGTGDISTDPKLLAVEFKEVHLAADSPCIGAGDDTAVQADWPDMDGESRVQGGHVDIGADEYNGTTPAFSPNVVRVSASGSDSNDGSSWTLAKLTVQAGIEAALHLGGGEVWVGAGAYSERITLRRWVQVYGGFIGTEDRRGDRNTSANVTVLDGGQGGSVVSALAGSGICGIDGFTIRNGSGTLVSGSGRLGGGVYCDSSLARISKNRITGNSAISGGGGIYCMNSYTTISGNLISGNSGGGIGCSQGSTVILNNAVTSNTRNGGISCAGGATIANNAVMGNSASGGGGIYCFGDPVIISNNTIIGNSDGRGGGGIYCYCYDPPAVVSNNIVAFNSSGILSDSSVKPILHNNCVFNPLGSNYSGLTPGSGDISLDPQIPGGEYGQLHLAAGSPCVDAGDDLAVAASWTDADGESRIQAGRVDIGADEFNGTTPSYVPTVVRVSPFGDNANDGSSWGLAKRTVQAGVDAAWEAGGGEVWVAGGTYNGCVVLKPWVYLSGGFAGTESCRDQREWREHVTVLDGGATGSVVSAVSTGCTGAIDGFTVRNGTGTISGSNRCGGGIYCYYSSPRIANNAITDNAANPGNGGGIYCEVASPLISINVIARNTVGAGNGGGVYCTNSFSAILDNVIEGNAADKGGGVYSVGSPLAMADNVVVGNVASGFGGGMYNASSGVRPTLTNCTFSGNLAPAGAGFYTYSSSRPVMVNCILWGNSGPSVSSPTGGVPTLSYCDVEGGWNGTGNIDSNPKFVRLPCPGTDGTWGTADDDYGDLRLLAGSPCIDAGEDAAAVGAGLLVDLDGFARFVNDPATVDCTFAPGTCGTGPIVDMGAYEFIPGDYDRDGDVDLDDLAGLQGCASGPAVAYTADCLKADFDRDGDVDQEDFGVFQRCFGGAGKGVGAGCE